MCFSPFCKCNLDFYQASYQIHFEWNNGKSSFFLFGSKIDYRLFVQKEFSFSQRVHNFIVGKRAPSRNMKIFHQTMSRQKRDITSLEVDMSCTNWLDFMTIELHSCFPSIKYFIVKIGFFIFCNCHSQSRFGVIQRKNESDYKRFFENINKTF